MKKSSLLAIIAMLLVNVLAFGKGKKIEVNGEKVVVEEGIYAKLETTLGDILIELNTSMAPMTSASFVLLAEGTMPLVSEKYQGKPYFNGLTFHRVIPEFMIQGGDPDGNGQGGPGYQFPNEVSDSLTHNKGVISMANAGPGTNGSQFFITVAETHQLDGGYSVFGKVLAGQNVADSISKVERNKQDKPNTPVIMNTVSIIRIGKTFKKWDAYAVFEAGKSAAEAAKLEEEARKVREEEEAKAKSEALRAELMLTYPTAKTSPTGLLYIIEKVGDGTKPTNGEMVNVHYAGYFADGRLFDSSIKAIAEANNQYNPQREPYDPMAVPYGPEASLIPGFKEGVAMLNVGGKAKIIIPPSLAYGERGAGGIIPPHAWLIFDIELVSIVEKSE
jgi:peptidylprolyl isomerase